MSQVRLYINTFDSNSIYSGFNEYTSDAEISTLGLVSQKLDSNEYDVGVFKNTNINIKLRNDHGRFSDSTVAQSIFIEKRIDSLIKLTWQVRDEPGPICGVAICGVDTFGTEETIFYGLINDVATSQDIKSQLIKFSCQGLESIFERVETNYSSLSVSDSLETTIYNILNQTEITNLINVSPGNINVGENQIPDDISSLEETTVKEALDTLLEITNSILYIEPSTQTVYVKARTPSASVEHTFYGQASNNGSEDIVNIAKVRTGLNKTFNFFKWTDTTITSKNTTSISNNGVRKKEISSDLLTNTTKRTNVLDNYLAEFQDPKKELELTSLMNYDTLALFLLDRVAIDYPTVLTAAPGSNLPLYGQAVYGVDKYAVGRWNLTIGTETNWKILGRKINLKNETITYDLREI